MRRIATTLCYALLAAGVVGTAASDACAAQLYWDSDANAANNNIGTGAGLGGTGTWTNAGANWYDGSADAAWIANSDAVFEGTAGTITLNGDKSVNSLAFKTTGYSLGTNSYLLTMTGSNITTDVGVTATINSQLVGSPVNKNGPGTLVLAGSNNYGGGTSINDGVLVISADSNLGQAPLTPFSSGHDITLDGGTLRLNASVTIHPNRTFMIGPDGGTIDTQSFPNSSSGSSQENHGPGDLTKLGSGTLYARGSTFNTLWTGRLIIKEGTWRIQNASGLPYDVPAADGVKADQVILDGGTLLYNESTTLYNPNVRRGITVAAGGGTISGLIWPGPVTSSVPNAVLNISNGSTLQSSDVPSTFQGTVNINSGVLELNGGTAMGDTAAIVVGNPVLPFARLTISGGTETIGSLSGGGSTGNLELDSTLVTGNNNASTTFNGVISGAVAAGLTKVGTGTFTLTNNNNYAGVTTVNGGTLLVNNPPSTTGTGHSGTGSGTIVVNAGGILGGTGNHNGAVTINDGGLANGPARIFGSSLYGGVTVNSGGTLAGNITISGPTNGSLFVASGGHVAPGASIGTINSDSLNLAAGSVLDFDLDTVLGVDKSDLLNVLVTNGLTINGGTINLTNLGHMTVGTYTLIDYIGNLSGSVGNLSFGTLPAGFSYSLINNTTNKSIDLIVGVVPEPATWMLCAMAVAVSIYRASTKRSRMA